MAEITIHRRVEWYDTDAAGHQHHSLILRLVEAAEAELLREHGLQWLFGRAPRVRHEVNYRQRLWFGEPVRVVLRTTRLGRSSLTFEFEIHGENGIAADGLMTVVHAAPDAPKAAAWPRDVVDAFGEDVTAQ